MRRFAMLVLCAPFLAWGAAPSVSVVDASIKVRPTDAVSGAGSAAIGAAKNEFEAFQVVVSGGATGVTGANVTATSLTGPGGAAIAASEVRLYREGYLNLATQSDIEGATGRWPDPLIPDVDEIAHEKRNAFPFSVPAGESRVVFVEVRVPKTAVAGAYTGKVTVTGTGLGTVDVPVALTVWSFELPSTSSLPSTFGMGWSAPCVAHYGSYEACGGDSGVVRMRLLYARFMLDHRITADVVYTGPSASGQGYDWAGTFDNSYGPLFDGTDPALLLEGAKQTTIRYSWKGDQAHYQAWASHFRQKGWFDRTYDYTCDEPPATCAWNDINTRGAMIHAADADFRTLVTTTVTEANQQGVLGAIDTLVPVINYLDDKAGNSNFSGNQRPQYDGWLGADSGRRLYWYQSCMSHGCGGIGGSYFNGWPSYMIDTSGVQNRAMEWMSFLYRMGGELYFETTYDLSTAWTDQYSFGGNGDGTLLYPGKPSVIGGTTDIPVASYRLKMIRQGMEDYEYLKLVSDLGDAAFAKSTAAGLFPTAHDARQPADKLAAARLALATRIMELKGVAVPVDPPPVVPALETCARRTSGTVTVDGDLTEFAAAKTVAINAGTEARLLWDAEKLYLGYHVKDAVLQVNEGGRDGEVWNGDGVELMLDTHHDRTAALGTDDFHLLVNVNSDLLDERGAGASWDRSWTAGAAVSVARRADGYDVELAVPWQQLGVTPTGATRLGLDLAVNDTDVAGQVTPADWAGLTRFAQPDKWGSVVLGGVGCEAIAPPLVEDPPPTPQDPEAAQPAAAKPDTRTTQTPVGCSAGAGAALPSAVLSLLFFAVARRRRNEAARYCRTQRNR